MLAHSRDLAEALAAQMPDFEVRLAMCYGEPSIPAVLRALPAQGVERVLVLPLYPQYAASTTAAALDAVMAELMRWRRLPELRWINDYHVDEGWLDALEASVETHWDLHGRSDMLLMSFHGLPVRFVSAGDPYQQQCEAGARALAKRLGPGWGRRLMPACASWRRRASRPWTWSARVSPSTAWKPWKKMPSRTPGCSSRRVVRPCITSMP